VVLSYLSAEQLRLVGADVFIVNILGIGIVRELGPSSARSWSPDARSAITASSGHEGDRGAGCAFGDGHLEHPALDPSQDGGHSGGAASLVLWTSASRWSGRRVGESELGMSFFQFFTALPAAFPESICGSASARGVVFGVLIALIACHFGLRHPAPTRKASPQGRLVRW